MQAQQPQNVNSVTCMESRDANLKFCIFFCKFLIMKPDFINKFNWSDFQSRFLKVQSKLEIIVVVARIPDETIELKRNLSPCEIQRANAYVKDCDQIRYITAHALKRLALGSVLGVDPTDLSFTADDFGRPFLTMQANPELDFNLTHSGELVGIVIGENSRVGIDIELPRNISDSLMDSIRHPNETEVFPDRTDFYRMWTVKEAVSKVIGTGLSEDFSNMHVERSTHKFWNYQYKQFVICHMNLHSDYHLAVATNNPEKQIRYCWLGL